MSSDTKLPDQKSPPEKIDTTRPTTFKWSEVNHTHHGKAATVRTPKTFPNAGMWNGIIRCPTNGSRPTLSVGKEHFQFAWWHDVVIQ
jgi:hypothetical protein